MHCIGIDPAFAKPVAWAMRIGGAWEYGSVSLQDRDALQAAFANAAKHGATHAVIEGGYVGADPLMSLRLEAARERLRIYAENAWLIVVNVPPATWQRDMLTANGYTPKKHADIVRMARYVAEKVHKLDGLSEDETVAVCLADWGDLQKEA